MWGRKYQRSRLASLNARCVIVPSPYVVSEVSRYRQQAFLRINTVELYASLYRCGVAAGQAITTHAAYEQSDLQR